LELESRPLRVEPVPFLWAMGWSGKSWCVGLGGGLGVQLRAFPATLIDCTITRVNS
jgi:hypothetical protein